MPDIKSALEKALAQTANAWAADDEAHQKIQPQQEKPVITTTPKETIVDTTTAKQDGRITNNVSRTTFEYVRDNPGLTIDEVTAALVAKGFKTNSVSSLCYQMLRVRLVVADANGKLTAVVREYLPIQTSLLRGRKAKPKAKPKAAVEAAPAPAPERKKVVLVSKRTGEIINPKPAAGIAALPTNATTALYTTPAEWTVDSVIGGLNVRQAMAVYAELRNIFGA